MSVAEQSEHDATPYDLHEEMVAIGRAARTAAGVLAIMGRVRRTRRREKKAQTTEQNSS